MPLGDLPGPSDFFRIGNKILTGRQIDEQDLWHIILGYQGSKFVQNILRYPGRQSNRNYYNALRLRRINAYPATKARYRQHNSRRKYKRRTYRVSNRYRNY